MFIKLPCKLRHFPIFFFWQNVKRLFHCFPVGEEEGKKTSHNCLLQKDKLQKAGILFTSLKLKPHIKHYYHFEIFGHAKTNRQARSKRHSVVSLVVTALPAS